MDKQVVDEYLSLAIRGLKARAKIYSKDINIKNSITQAIQQVEAAKLNKFDSEESLHVFIRSIWSKIYGSLVKIKAIEDIDNDHMPSTIKRVLTHCPDRSCRSCDHYCFKLSPFGCPFQCNEPPYCAGFKLCTKGEIYY